MIVGKSVGEEEVKRHERIVFLGLFTEFSITWTPMHQEIPRYYPPLCTTDRKIA